MTTLIIVLVVLVLVVISAICSGLNIGLMALDTATLKRKARLGDKQAKRILPLRRRSHLSLASILISNVAVISATSLVMANILNGFVAGIISTLMIVIFGEVLPQAYFAKHALQLVSSLAWMLRLMIVVTYPLSRPLEILLDKILSHDDDDLHSRQELGLIIDEHRDHNFSELDDDEVEIIQGALELSEKRVQDVMTAIDDTYWLPNNIRITPKIVDQMATHKRSRIPVFEPDLSEPEGMIILKDLIDMDLDETQPLITQLPLHDMYTVGDRTALDTMLRKFIRKSSHLFAVTRNDEIVGIVSIEDVLEEIIGHEIEDETETAKLESATVAS